MSYNFENLAVRLPLNGKFNPDAPLREQGDAVYVADDLVVTFSSAVLEKLEAIDSKWQSKSDGPAIPFLEDLIAFAEKWRMEVI